MKQATPIFLSTGAARRMVTGRPLLAQRAYVTFGRAMGYMNSTWVDVHGAGAQRSDPKAGNPADYPTGNGPQGDAIRIYNYVRLVRDAGATTPQNSKTYLPLIVKSVSLPSNTPTSSPTSLPSPSPTLLPPLTPNPTSPPPTHPPSAPRTLMQGTVGF